eukprot:TRINITY_DN69950_c0_g1_i1.p1 TRINITY_DN69950_c0_g1~~TRINITY_DN69950_c0_g1_i1.p1  ORF type:complete len:257 (-),score=29.52 TRINITY_DN69950_c0_g1_i1:75-845(-)
MIFAPSIGTPIVLCAVLLAGTLHGACGQTSFTSFSMTWTRGSDGRVREEMHQVQDDVIPDGSAVMHVQSESACLDGRCRERKTVSEEPRSTGRFAFLGRIADSGHAHRTPVIVLARGGLSSAGAWAALQNGPRVSNSVAPPQAQDFVSDVGNVLGPGVFAAFTLTFAALLAIMLCRTGESAIEARERPLAELAEPLAIPREPKHLETLSSFLTLPSVSADEQKVASEASHAVQLDFHLQPSVGTWLCQRLSREESD